ncbi:serine/threonine-protein kinase [Nonomuraea dietziae]|uniref:serine/threonine-protein kinase n=1 Tax=Nonomuraea dietziae TaxID=65515 RepID=UPI0033F17AE7
MSESPGIIGGRYRLLRTIGRGGMGTVWHAYDEVLGRDVAVKEVLPPPDLSGPEREIFTVRTFREARAAGRVAHPGVATVYDVVQEGGHPWIIMELVRSRTLGSLVRERGPLEPARVAEIGLEILAALRAAHAVGVLHRDVKPDNVLLAEDGRAVLTDFGIATTEDEAPVTRTGILVGTPAFIAPERAAGGSAEPASDLWSLGVTLYTAVEGHSPFHRGHALATLAAVMHDEPMPMASAGPLAPVVHGLLRKDPAERMDIDEAERRLRPIVLGLAPEATAPVPVVVPPAPVGSAVRPAAHGKRPPPLVALAAAATVVALVTGGMAWMSGRAETPQPKQPASVPSVVSTPKETSEPAPAPAPEPTAVSSDDDGTQPARQAPTSADVGRQPKQSRPPARTDQDRPSPKPTRSKGKAKQSSPPAEETEEPTDEPTADPPADDTPDDAPADSGQVEPDEGEAAGEQREKGKVKAKSKGPAEAKDKVWS